MPLELPLRVEAGCPARRLGGLLFAIASRRSGPTNRRLFWWRMFESIGIPAHSQTEIERADSRLTTYDAGQQRALISEFELLELWIVVADFYRAVLYIRNPISL